MDTVAHAHLLSMLDELPPEGLKLVEEFVQFLRQQVLKAKPAETVAVKESQKPYLYPTVTMPAESMRDLIGIMPVGYEGDALEDSEALYDEA